MIISDCNNDELFTRLDTIIEQNKAIIELLRNMGTLSPLRDEDEYPMTETRQTHSTNANSKANPKPLWITDREAWKKQMKDASERVKATDDLDELLKTIEESEGI